MAGLEAKREKEAVREAGVEKVEREEGVAKGAVLTRKSQCRQQ